MKNSLNLIGVALILVILGCSCPNKLKELGLDNKSATPIPNTPTMPFNSANAPNPPDAPDAPNAPTSKGKYTISLDKYNQIKNGSTYAEAVNVLGGEGAEVSSSEIGKYKTATYKWDGENYSYIILTFQNDKLMFKSQGGLK